jgi:hypothetical protein
MGSGTIYVSMNEGHEGTRKPNQAASEEANVTYEEEQVFHIDVTLLCIEARTYLDSLGLSFDMIALAVDDTRMANRVAR